MNPRTDQNSIDLFDAVDARLKRLVFRLGMPAAECEDCAQDVWLAFLLGHADWALEKPYVQAWLCGVARKKAIDYHRRQHRNPVHSLDEDVVIEAHGKGGTDDAVGEKFGPTSPVLSAIQDALNELAPVSRGIFLHHARDDFDYAHIGEIVGHTPAEVRARFSRARRQLRKRLANDPRCMRAGGGGMVGWGLWAG